MASDGNDAYNQLRAFRLQDSESSDEQGTSSNKQVPLQQNHEHIDVSSETLPLLGRFSYGVIMKVSTSEPRDVLQLERTCLTFIRFAASLFFTALGIIINFKLDSSGKKSSGNKNKPFDTSKYSIVVSFILFALSFAVLVVSGINYFVTVKRYADHKIQTYNFNNIATVICMTFVIVTLVAINISLIVEGYLE